MAVIQFVSGGSLYGGGVLRAIIWETQRQNREGNQNRRLSATIDGRWCGSLSEVIGARPTSAILHGPVVGSGRVFLLGAATSVVRSTRDSATVAQAMSPPIAIEPDLPINRFVDEILAPHRQVTSGAQEGACSEFFRWKSEADPT